MKTTNSDSRFIELWNSPLSGAEVATQLGMKRGTAHTYASRLRAQGHELVNKNTSFSREYRQEIGRRGGTKSCGGGFSSDIVGRDGLTGKQRAVVAGTRGGYMSRRGKAGDRA